MTSHELARKLLEMPDVMVTVRGYEAGVNEVLRVWPAAPLALDVEDSPDIYGRHKYERHTGTFDNAEGCSRVPAIHIGEFTREEREDE